MTIEGMTEWLKQKAKPILGGVIAGVVYDDEEGFYGFSVETVTGETVTVWILRDDEGNGPGAFDITHGDDDDN